MTFRSTNYNPKPYVPKGLSEVEDQLGSMVLSAPTFIDKTGWFEDEDIESEFNALIAGFDVVRVKLGEERHAKLVALAERAKVLFAEDEEDTNGKTDQGRKLLFEMEDLIREVRSKRVKARLKDDEGEVTGD